MLQLHVYMTQNKTKYTPKKKKLAVTAGCVRFFEKRLKAVLGGEGKGGRLESSVGGFAYSAGWSAEFPGNSVLCGTGHCGGNLVNGVRRCCGASGIGGHAAGEGAWERDWGSVWRQKEEKRRQQWRDETVSHGSEGFMVFVWLLFIPACFVMHVAAPTTKITQFIGFPPTITKLAIQTLKKVSRFGFVLPLRSLEWRCEKVN